MLSPIRMPRAAALALTLAVGVGTALAQAPLRAVRVVSGLELPLFATSPPGDATRLFVVEQFTARILILRDGALLPAPFLDLDPIVTDKGPVSGRERGLLGLAFHPDYRLNRRFYVSYTDNDGRSVVREYLRDAADPDRADPASFTTVFGPLDQPYPTHNGGGIEFGPDGMLWLGLGDGGAAFDPQNRAQDLTSPHGKLHRLDVGNAPTYAASDNPFAGPANDPGDAIPDTIWAFGLRNPWRFSFDRWTGALYLADVGQGAREEVDIRAASSAGGENYGWRCMEGSSCTGLTGCACGSGGLVAPAHEYDHAGGNCSITGGHVYRGSAIPGLGGAYFFADFCSGRIWTLRWDGTAVTEVVERTTELVPDAGSIDHVTSFGQDADGELYVVDQDGEVFRIERACAASADCVQTFCNGDDDALDACPCGNAGDAATGCDLAQPTGGVEAVVLAQDTALRRATLTGRGFPPARSPTALVLRATMLDPAGPQAFGDGVRCVATTPLVRLAATSAAGGTSTHVVPHGTGPGLFRYQIWFRNAPASACVPAAAFNLSSGVTLLW